MPRQLSSTLKNQLFSNHSDDPFLMLMTFSHASFADIYLVNNTEAQISNGQQYEPFPFKITLPMDDGESDRSLRLQVDNVSLDLITELRSVIDPIDVSVKMILASDPDNVEFEYGELKLKTARYNNNTIIGNLVLDDFMNTEIPSEKYTPTLFPGIFQ